MVAGVSTGALEGDILAVGRDLAAALPGHARHPMKVLDDRAMDLASQDAELRAALFRFVDVVPAARSLDDLAAHLTAFLDEVTDRPIPMEMA
ncbi:MAG: proline dehydrogenase, partial [Solirubrobacteraceae bacterium]|nr:proline dehydrogenase [Solirubrobacteraceae bacterium]